MKRKFCLASLGLAALPLAACGGGDNTATSSAPATVSSSSSSSTTPSFTTSASAPSTSSAPKNTAQAAPSTKTVSPSPSTKNVAPKTTAAAPTTAVQMGGKCGTVASGYTIYADAGVACDYAMRVAAQVHENPPSSVTAYSSKLQKNVTSSCFEGATANIVCTTPSGSWIKASVRG